MALSLTEKDVAESRKILQDLLVRAEADGCVVCDCGGYVLAQEGRGAQDPLLLSALGAGVFGASRELARLLGEDEFSAVFHQGERKSIFIRAVDTDILLVIIFSNSASVGLVKFYAAPAASELKGVFAAVREAGEQVDHPEQSFVLSQGADLFSIR